MVNRAALYTPYANTLGGGERYLLTLAQVLLDRDWSVDVTFENEDLLGQAKRRFNLSLKEINLVDRVFLEQKPYLNHRHYDLLFWVSDGSIPTMMAKKNWLHFQVPFHNLGGKSLFNIMKLRLVDRVICNSFFTKKIIDAEYGLSSSVWYPPVAVDDFTPGKKENLIVAVGRFETTMNVKRQDVLVSAFKKLIDEGLIGWRLVLLGGSLAEEEDNVFLQKLKNQARKYPIEFMVNAPFEKLKETYSSAKIFWHAAGFGIDEEKEPERVEHFGMTTIEAMASGCWPLVYEAGGQREIFENFSQKNLCLWQNENQLLEKTKKVVAQKPTIDPLINLARRFSVTNFTNNVKKAL
ncbi:MAG: glycosyltransferase [Candidatus Shapirobacteria bacterium]|nr:glycosyltransferase [Candidatus Shapirobacteria bacterium]MDD5074151.1 glycosyltransferase [Candidatus Shapirobacteria bacterium]